MIEPQNLVNKLSKDLLHNRAETDVNNNTNSNNSIINSPCIVVPSPVLAKPIPISPVTNTAALSQIDIKSILNGAAAAAVNQHQLFASAGFNASPSDGSNAKTSLNNGANGEHKLLNGLLSKPIINSNDKNQPNITIQSGSMDQYFKQASGQSNNSATKYNKYFTNDDFTINNGDNNGLKNGGSNNNNSSNGSSPSSNNDAVHPIGFHGHQSGGLKPVNGNKNLLAATATTTNIELNLLELILNEIDMCVENKESRERMRQMITQMHIYFTEKLNDQRISKSKMQAEFDEVNLLNL